MANIAGVPLHLELSAIGSNALPEDYRQRSRAVEHVLESLIAINRDHIRRFPMLPRFERSGVRYKKDLRWMDIPLILDRKGADCKSLVAYRIADLRERDGIDAKPFVSWKRSLDGGGPAGRLRFHVQVLFPNGQVEDPCRRMGM